MQKDDVFGNISWERDVWVTTASIPYFIGSGERVYMPQEDRQSLPSAIKLPLKIETGGVRKKPSKAQQAAWLDMNKRGDAMWDEAMDGAIAEYRHQRPMRVRYWRVVNNPRLLSQSMPAEPDRSTMKQLVVPLFSRIQPEDKDHGTVDFFITFLSTWWSEGINIYIRDGRVRQVAPTGSTQFHKLPWIDTPVFGELRRRPAKRTPWYGEIQLEPFTSFAAVAVNRATWDASYTRSSEATSDLPWDVARGQAVLSVYAPPDVQPSSRQSTAFEEFVKAADQATTRIIEELTDLYRVIAPARRQAYQGPDPEVAFPSLENSSGLREITELQELYVFPEDDGPVALGFKFRGPWTGSDGIGVRWRDGEVEAIGHPSVADPDRFQ